MGFWKQKQLEEITPSFNQAEFCTGIAKLTILETGEVFEVSPDDLDWDVGSSSERGMGEELHHYATIIFESEQGRQEIAPYLFQTGRLTLGYASQLADMQPNDFRQLLKQQNIPLYSYDVEDFELDLKNLRELGRL
ncbi:UPF0175 family protein [Nostoc sp. UHCC 0251]|uniref:UPF0175 family protein n=1 Tax=Nostoc sp. UHCC 0251 TaxID=3110240 RepID=UPI002B218C3F|nr:UPF0175 family protein [Nostoc sp. UHCC 0251]MEA5624705.1 UPF0175 family protein [Nostoc sp. UHCC 0251]